MWGNMGSGIWGKLGSNMWGKCVRPVAETASGDRRQIARVVGERRAADAIDKVDNPFLVDALIVSAAAPDDNIDTPFI